MSIPEEDGRVLKVDDKFYDAQYFFDDPVEESQKAKADAGKEQLTLVPRRIIHDICQIRMYGNKKYPDGGPDNWKRVSKERYRDAAFRHFLAYLDDPQGVDEESGFPHYWHLVTNLAFLCEFEDAEREKRLKEAK
jgi:hypothetical protein